MALKVLYGSRCTVGEVHHPVFSIIYPLHPQPPPGELRAVHPSQPPTATVPPRVGAPLDWHALYQLLPCSLRSPGIDDIKIINQRTARVECSDNPKLASLSIYQLWVIVGAF